jgi:hypothetical protein
MMSERLKFRLFFCLGILLSFVVSIALLEVLIRQFFPRVRPSAPIMEADNDLRWCLKPNLRVIRYSPTIPRERPIEIVTNNQRLRELEDIPYENRSGEKRILFLGDSCTFGMVSTGEDFVTATQECLKSKIGAKARCINMGAPGIGASLELIYYLKAGRKYGASVVVVQVCGNDVADDARDNVFSVEKDGNLEENPFRMSRRQKFLTRFPLYVWLSEHSYLLQLIKMNIPDMWYNRDAVVRESQAYKSSGFASYASTTRLAWIKLIENIRKDGAIPVFLLVDEPSKTSLLGETYGLAAEVATSRGVRVICPVPVLKKHFGRLEDASISALDAHWHPAANRVVGDLLCEVVLKALSEEATENRIMTPAAP